MSRSHNRGVLFFILLFIGLSTLVYAYNPPQGGEDFYRYYSPEFLSGTASVSSQESPQADAVNPAASGGQQRTTLDGSYIIITDFASATDFGHAANLGATFPTRYGVFSGSLHFLTTNYTDTLSFGTLGGLNFSFAKDLFPNFYIGSGLSVVMGSFDRFDWGLWLDLGVMHFPGTLWGLKDFHWGASLRGLGKWFDPTVSQDVTAFPSPFTPQVGAGFNLIDSKDIRMDVSTDLSFPFFQNLKLDLGAQLSFRDFLGLRTSLSLDLRELIDGQPKSFIPSLGLYVKFRTSAPAKEGFLSEQGWNRSDIKIQTAALPLYSNRWALGLGVNVPLGVIDRTPPVIDVEYPEVLYLSPNNDGKNDDLILPIRITDERYIKGYSLIIRNSAGETVRTIMNKDERPENVTFQNLIKRLTYVKEGIPIPETLRWDAYSEGGTIVPDGEYSFVLQAWDDNGNLRETEPRKVFVDNTPPEIILLPPTDPLDMIFSPDGDGNKDTFTFRMSGSREDRWVGLVKDSAGETVRSFVFENQAPSDIVWDGKNDAEIMVPDGVYYFSISATDRAKNHVSAELSNIIVNTARPTLSLKIDNPHFSPNRDRVKDTVTFFPEVSVKTGIVSWKLEILDSSGRVQREFNNQSQGVLQDSILFDGRDSRGNILPEGQYSALLTLLYQNGYNPNTRSPFFTLDITPPSARVNPEYRVFSPNGDGRRETLTFAQDSSQEDEWEGAILDSQGRVIKKYYWPGKAETTVTWDGRRDDNTLAADGIYTYSIFSVDRAGNRGESAPVSIELSTLETPVSISVDYNAFSPNANGVRDTLPIRPKLTVDRNVEWYNISVVSEAGSVVRTFSGRGMPEPVFEWNGLNDSGARVQDGIYYVTLEMEYWNGNKPTARTPELILDRVAPEAVIAANYTVFSPDGDGNKDTITFEVKRATPEDRWKAEVKDKNNNVVYEYNWVGKPEESFIWDGRGKDGRYLPDGDYSLRLITTDRAGNTGGSQPVNFRIDTADTPVLLSVEHDAFSPNNDGRRDTLTIIPQAKVVEGVENYTLSIKNEAGTEVRRFTGKERLDESYLWDGMTQSNTKAPDGAYTAEIRVEYINGNISSARTQPFYLDTRAPEASAAGDLALFSPNNDGFKDVIRITQSGSSEELWEGKITDAQNNLVRKFSWRDKPEAVLVWNGIGDNNRQVPDGVYTYRLESEDRAGNIGTSKPVTFEILTIATPLSLSANLEAFSPNGNGIKDQIRITPQVAVTRGIENYTLKIVSAEGISVRSFTGRGAPPADFIWDGTRDNRSAAPDGPYTAVLGLEYSHGNRPEARSGMFVKDTVFPEITVSANLSLFSPNKDGKKDSLRITQQSSREELWEGIITNARWEEIRKFLWKNNAETFDWDGTDSSGNTVPDGAYTYTVRSTDAAGNETRKSLSPLTVDNRPTTAIITANKTGFSPRLAGPDSTIGFSLYAGLREGISSWSVSMIDQNGTIQKQFGASAEANTPLVIPGTLTWDGKNERGSVVEGSYTANFRIVYAKGDEPEARTMPFLLDTSPPEAKITLSPLPFSPDNDGVNDELFINLNLTDRSGIRDWTFAITDPTGSPFISFTGRGNPAERIIWNGISSTGELVQAAEDYPYLLTATDTLGNSTVYKGLIPVDVLVIREGDRLKIKISSINFEPNRANVILDNSENGQKNLRILTRLVEILNKYRTYKIVIEGHAVSEFWNIPARAQREEVEELQPLSKARADSVREYLVRNGIEAGRLSTIGLGGTQPIVPHSDLQNRWKNRRVEFILIRP